MIIYWWFSLNLRLSNQWGFLHLYNIYPECVRRTLKKSFATDDWNVKFKSFIFQTCIALTVSYLDFAFLVHIINN